MPGLPRPRADGMPVPWTTFMLDTDDVWWRTVDTPRLLRCQSEWLCQVCGLELPTAAWVVVDSDGEIISDAALHRHCLTVAYRWCPHLKRSAYRLLEVVDIAFSLTVSASTPSGRAIPAANGEPTAPPSGAGTSLNPSDAVTRVTSTPRCARCRCSKADIAGDSVAKLTAGHCASQVLLATE